MSEWKWPRSEGTRDSTVGGAHKEALVNIATWTWRGSGPYVVNFVAKDNKGRLLGQKSVTIYVAH